MARYVAISRANHSNKSWHRYQDFLFASNDAVVPLVSAEISKAATAFPIAFAKNGERYTLVGVLGLVSGKNLFVAPNGKWVGAYIPAAYRSHPFALGGAEDGAQVLCIDEDSGLITEDCTGEPFFDTEGTVTESIAQVVDFLTKVFASRAIADHACEALAMNGVICPWEIEIKGANGVSRIEGLYRIDERALNALPPENFAELRNVGALVVAYCQLISVQHFQELGKLADAHAKGASLLASSSRDLDLEFLNGNDTIKFGGLH